MILTLFSFKEDQMRLSRLLLIFLALSFMFAACASDEEDEETQNGNNSSNQEENNGNNPGENNEGGNNQHNSECGNQVIDAGEICDGDTKNCAELDPGYTSGIAICNSDCSGWNTTNCSGTPADSGDSGEIGDTGNTGTVSGFDKNSQGIWVDPDTCLIWENPMGNQGVSGTGISHANAVTYCDNLVLAGADDWRMPTIDELRTLVRGVSTTMTGGKCPTSEGCAAQNSCNKDKDNTLGFGNSCMGCDALDTTQYDPAVSYLNFEEDCRLGERNFENGQYYIVPAMYGDPYRLWSSTKNEGLIGFWYVNYISGQINSGNDGMSSTHWVRCVRAGSAADVPEHEAAAATDPSWECISDTECPEGKWCSKNRCVVTPGETYLAANGLEWQNGTVDEILNKWDAVLQRVKGWENAKTYCEDLNYAGHDDWRLPNLTELKSLVIGCAKTNECKVDADNAGYSSNFSTACNGCGSGNYLPEAISQQIDDSYWTSTNDPTKTNRVWAINFMTGAVFYSYDSANHYTRCVRGSMN